VDQSELIAELARIEAQVATMAAQLDHAMAVLARFEPLLAKIGKSYPLMNLFGGTGRTL
jgi:hypothetical protein